MNHDSYFKVRMLPHCGAEIIEVRTNDFNLQHIRNPPYTWEEAKQVVDWLNGFDQSLDL